MVGNVLLYGKEATTGGSISQAASTGTFSEYFTLFYIMVIFIVG